MSGHDAESLRDMYRDRFDTEDRERIDAFWRAFLDEFLARRLGSPESVLDLGAGNCEFINRVDAPVRYAVDLNPDVATHAEPGVQVVLTRSQDLGAIASESIDLVWSSNFFEHLPASQDLLDTLGEVRRVLRPGGRLLVLMPNLRATGPRYFDFLDHSLPLTDRSLVEALRLAGLSVDEVIPRLIPYSDNPAGRPGRQKRGGGVLTPARFERAMRLYLRQPWAWRRFGGQMFVSAQR